MEANPLVEMYLGSVELELEPQLFIITAPEHNQMPKRK
jgi:hypothetical protein